MTAAKRIWNVMAQPVRMDRLFALLLLAMIAVTSTVSACSSSDMADDSLAKTVDELKAKAEDAPVRVIVKVEPENDAQDASASTAKAKLNAFMQAAGVTQIQPIEGQPLIVMELTADQLDRLLASGMVLSMQEDIPVGF